MYPTRPDASYIEAFATVAASVSAAFPGLSQMPVLEARSYKYPTLHACERGRMDSDTIRSGKAIQTSIDVSLDGDYGGYEGQEDWTFQVSEGVDFLTSHWRKEKGTASIHEDELDAMFAGGVWDQASMAATLVREDQMRRRRMIVDAVEKIEASFWAAPDAKMEGAKASSPVRSIPSFVNEFDNGLAPGFTTQHGLTAAEIASAKGPDGEQLLQADVRRYVSSLADGTVENHLIDVLNRAVRDNRRELIPLAPEYSQIDDVLLDSYPGFFCSSEAIDYMSRLYRAQKELYGFTNPNGADMGMRQFIFDGKPFIDVPALKGAKVYPTYTGGNPDASAALVSDRSTAGNPGPRFWMLDMPSIGHYYHAGKKMEVRDWYALDQTNPEQYVMWLRNKRCIHSKRLRGHVLIAPSETIAGWATA